MTTSEADATPAATENTQTSALQFLRWAYTRGLLTSDAYYPGETVGVPSFGAEEPSVTAVGILRNRQIRFVGIDRGHRRISVFLRKAAPTVAELKVLPKFCNGSSLQYHQGSSETVSPAAVAEVTAACSVYSVAGHDFYTCGSSISVGNNREAGTLGCLVRDAAGELFGLTNSHVSAACSYAPNGLPVLAPGVIDVTPYNPHPFTIGTHARQLPMVTGDPSSIDHTLNSDAALFKITAPHLISSMHRTFYDTPTSVLDMVAGMTVQKVGRTTGLRNGKVHTEVVGASAVNYTAGQYGFAGAVYLEPLFEIHGEGDIFSDGGDSGSLVTHLDSVGVRHAVGIVVAGCMDNSAPGGKRSLVLPLGPILAKLGVQLVSGHNV